MKSVYIFILAALTLATSSVFAGTSRTSMTQEQLDRLHDRESRSGKTIYLNEVFITRPKRRDKSLCAAVVWDEASNTLIRFEPCWPTDHDGSWLGDGRGKGVKAFMYRGQTCFRSTGKTLTFNEEWEGPQNQKGNYKGKKWALTVKQPIVNCYTGEFGF